MKTTEAIIVDTSVIIKWLSKHEEECIEQATLLLQRSVDGLIVIMVPDLVCYEVGNALLKGKGLNSAHAIEVLSFFYDLPLQFIPPSSEIAQRTYDLASKYAMTFYDASFVALAESKNALLVTADKGQKSVDTVKILTLSSYK